MYTSAVPAVSRTILEVSRNSLIMNGTALATTAAGKTIDVFMGATLIANDLAVPNTGNYQTYQTISVPSVTLPAGTQILKVLFNHDVHARIRRRALLAPGQELRHVQRGRQLRQ